MKLAWSYFKEYQPYLTFDECLKLISVFMRNEIDKEQAKLAKTWLVIQSFSFHHGFHSWNEIHAKHYQKDSQFSNTFKAFQKHTWFNIDHAIKAVKLWKLYHSKINNLTIGKYYSELMNNQGEPEKRLVFLHLDSRLHKSMNIQTIRKLANTSPVQNHYYYQNHPHEPTTTYKQNKGKYFEIYRDGKTTAVINNKANFTTDKGLKSSFTTDSKYVQEHKNPTRIIKKNSSAIRSSMNTARKKAIEAEASNGLRDANPSTLHQPLGQTIDIDKPMENLGHRQGVEDYNGKPQRAEEPEQLSLFPELYSNNRGDLIASEENVA
jgi:hypothetical protein